MTQRGAIFGLDVRLAIVIAGLMATAISAEMLSNFEGERQVKSDRKTENVRDALLTRYANSATTIFTSDASTLLQGGYLDNNQGYYAGDAAAQSNLDSWGTALAVPVVSATKTIYGMPVTSHFGVVASAGPDRVFQSATTLANEAAYRSWTLSGDDVGLKFNTILIDRDRVLRMQTQLRRIMEALATYAQRAESTAASACLAANCGCDDLAPTTCSVASVGYCDVTGDTYYCGQEERMYNFYPTEAAEVTANPSRAFSVVRSFTTYTSGNLASMQALMTLIGLPTAYAQDPWGRTLQYDSNAYDSITTPVNPSTVTTTASPAPYVAAVWFQ